MALGPVFMFCATRLVFDGTEGARSRFNVLRSRANFRRYRWRWIQFSCFGLPYPFWTVLRASGPVFMFCILGLVFGRSEGAGSSFHFLHSRTHFRCYEEIRVLF
jgi:hypothetical protein